MFRKVLVANRGEIAIRAFRAAYELGAATVAVFPHEDRNSEHRLKADEAYQIGEVGHPVRAYLSVEEVIGAARRSGADAIYPGYGFMSENPNLAEFEQKRNPYFSFALPSGRFPAALAGVAADPWTALVATQSEPAYAVVGLGTGTLAAFAKPYQPVDIYEIDPLVYRLSQQIDTLRASRDDLRLQRCWYLNGRHYSLTLEAWLQTPTMRAQGSSGDCIVRTGLAQAAYWTAAQLVPFRYPSLTHWVDRSPSIRRSAGKAVDWLSTVAATMGSSSSASKRNGL